MPHYLGRFRHGKLYTRRRPLLARFRSILIANWQPPSFAEAPRPWQLKIRNEKQLENQVITNVIQERVTKALNEGLRQALDQYTQEPVYAAHERAIEMSNIDRGKPLEFFMGPGCRSVLRREDGETKVVSRQSPDWGAYSEHFNEEHCPQNPDNTTRECFNLLPGETKCSSVFKGEDLEAMGPWTSIYCLPLH